MIQRHPADLSARKTYELIEEPVGQEYFALIDCALAYCGTAVVTVGPEPLSGEAREVLDRLGPHRVDGAPLPEPGRRAMVRHHLSRETAAVLKETADRLYAWRAPAMPADLSLLRHDGAPWLLSVADEELGYLELTPLEKLVVARTAPGVGAALAHQGARGARLAVFERMWETRLETLFREMLEYCRAVIEESREGLVDALRDWITSDEQGRITVTLELVGALRLVELRDEVDLLLQAVEREEYPVPVVFDRNDVLRERWRARYRRQLRRVLRALDAGQDGAF